MPCVDPSKWLKKKLHYIRYRSIRQCNPSSALDKHKLASHLAALFPLITYVFISAASLFMLSAPVRGCALVCINNRNISDLVLIAIQQPEGERERDGDREERALVETDWEETDSDTDRGTRSSNNNVIYQWRTIFLYIEWKNQRHPASYGGRSLADWLVSWISSTRYSPLTVCDTHCACMRKRYRCLSVFLSGLACFITPRTVAVPVF